MNYWETETATVTTYEGDVTGILNLEHPLNNYYWGSENGPSNDMIDMRGEVMLLSR